MEPSYVRCSQSVSRDWKPSWKSVRTRIVLYSTQYETPHQTLSNALDDSGNISRLMPTCSEEDQRDFTLDNSDQKYLFYLNYSGRLSSSGNFISNLEGYNVPNPVEWYENLFSVASIWINWQFETWPVSRHGSIRLTFGLSRIGLFHNFESVLTFRLQKNGFILSQLQYILLVTHRYVFFLVIRRVAFWNDGNTTLNEKS